MKHKRLILWSIAASLAGFLFGFDTIVISGAEQRIQDLWKLSGTLHGFAVSAALWGTVLGAIFGGIPSSKYGRKKCLVSIGFLYFVSAVGSGLAPDVYSFMIARFIGGVGVGAATVVSPMFISEISPADNRGKLAGLFQFNIVFGILVAFVSNYLFGTFGNVATSWRWMLGIEAVPAALYTLWTLSLPESPRWLITHAKQREAGAAIFQQINPEASAEEIETLVSEVEATVLDTKKTSRFWTMRLKLPIMMAFLIALFNQFSGINIILYFAPRLMGMAGLQNALAASASLGVTNLIFTFVGLYLIDKLGRRSLLYIGSIGYILSLGICAFAFLTTPGFKVAASAGDMVSAANAVVTVEKGEKFFTDEDKVAIYEGYEAAKVALVDASKTEGYEGEAIAIPAETTPADVIVIAEAGMDAASELIGPMSLVVLACLIAFIASHAVGQGAVIWVFIAEIFPNDHRAAGTALGSSTHWVCAATLTFLFPIAMAHFDAGVLFAFFTFCMCLQLLWVKLMVIETKGITLEEIEKKLGII
ncbi:MAG: sugar porter family MFS transporter [Kiritimatiellae bacterium]|nr:sugar porter family MFS transporter [Kiritimatiellia bacterium]